MEHAYRPAKDTDLDPSVFPPRPLTHHLGLTAYWLGNTLMWGALLHVALQSRLTDWFGENRVGFYIGILGFTGGTVGALTQVIVGAFSDRSANRWGRRRPYLTLGTCMTAAGLLAMGAAPSFWPFLGGLVLVQLFSNMALGPFTALLPDTVNPSEHGKASGFMGIARLLGDTGGLVLAGMLLDPGVLGKSPDHAAVVAFHDRRMFLLCAVIAGVLVLAMLYTIWAIRERPLRRRPEGTVSDILRGSLRLDVRQNRDFFWLSVSRAVTNLGFYIFLETLLFFLKYTLRLPNAEATTVVVLLPAIATGCVSSIVFGALSDRVGRRRLLFLAQFMMAACAVAFAFAPNVAFLVAVAVPAGVAYGIFTAVEWALACNLLPAGEEARYLGVWNLSAVLPQILALPLLGAVGSGVSAHAAGLGWRVDFAIAGVACLAGTYFLIHVRERARSGGAAGEAAGNS